MRKMTGIVIALLLIANVLVAAQQTASNPNFIIIFTDDQGYGDVGCYGNKNLRTPNLDKMAAEGIRFTDFYMAAAVCTPSRAALLTGCYPQRVGLPSVLFPNDMPRGQLEGMALGLNPEETTIAELLKEQGYATACIGKWHLGDMPEFMPLNQGFDEYFGLPYSNDMMPGATPHDFGPLPLIEGDSIIELNPDQDFLTIRYTKKAVDFIERNRNKTFFLYLSHSMPHRPCHASDKFTERWFTKQQLSGIKGENKESRDFLYPAVIEELDWSVGVILQKLEELGLEKNTLVVFTSDNGPATGSAGPLRGKKGSMYEGGMRVPCIMQWKGKIAEGKIVRQIIAGIDFYPTFANLASADLPADRIIDGKDITDLILGKTAISPRKQFLYFDQGRGLKAIRQGDWKLFPGENPQLYNLREDIGEKNNLAIEFPELVERLTSSALQFEKEMEKNKREPGLVPVAQ
jgi:arylsulfatase A